MRIARAIASDALLRRKSENADTTVGVRPKAHQKSESFILPFPGNAQER
jgi:hypothetical protein